MNMDYPLVIERSYVNFVAHLLIPILVGGLEHDFYFSISWEIHNPN